MAGEIGLGQAGALAYNIPQRFGLPQQGTPAGQPVAQQPQVQQLDPLKVGDHLLAEREKLTDDYYNNYGILDAYVKDMAKKGVDPFVPDYTQPGGGEVFKTLQRLKANYYHGANALAVEREAEKERAKDIADNKIRVKPGVDTQGFYAEDPNNFQNLQVDPMVIEKNQYLGDEFSTAEEVAKAKQTNYDPAITQLQQQRQAILARGGKEGVDTFEVDRALQTLVNPNKVNPALRSAAISANARIAAGKKNSADLNVLKDWYNAFSGNWKIDKDHPAKTRTDSVYGKVFVYDDKNGKKVGSWPDAKHILHDKTIKDIIKTPGGRVFVNYTDPAIPQDEVLDPQDFVQKAMSETSYGRAIALAGDEGRLDPGGALIPSEIADPYGPLYEMERQKQLGTTHEDVLKKVTVDAAKLDKLKTGLLWNDKETFDTPRGKVEVKVVDNGKYDIDNADTVIPNFDGDWTPYQGISKEKVLEILNNLDLYKDQAAPQGEPTPAAPGTTGQAPSALLPNDKYVASNGKAYTVEKLRASGYTDAQIANLPKQ